jgi:hypothetical protein
MSYQIRLEIDTGGPTPGRVWDDWNCTSNIESMWRAAGTDLASHEGRRADAVTEELSQAIKELVAHPDRYEPMNSPNGWGTYRDLLPKLRELLAAYRAHPLATVRIWRQ